MKVIRLALLVFVFLQSNLATAQQPDTILTFEEYTDRVSEHHPLALQAQLRSSFGEATLLQSRAGFEPKAGADVNQKYFSGDKYYSLIDAGLKVPTWFGVELKGGYELNEGKYLNPEHYVPDAGLWYAGISVPLGQGLFIDERRAALRKAQIYAQSTQAEQKAMLNDLLYEAGKTYWAWFESFNKLLVYKEAYTTAQLRFEAIQRSAQLGDRPYIDTLEASIQVQNRQVSLWDAELEYQNVTAQLGVFLWQDGNIPLELEDNTTPPSSLTISSTTVQPELVSQMDSLIDSHPQFLMYNYKVQELQVERRWKQEQLKPTVDLNYNAIAEPINGDVMENYSINNYKWGLSFSMPILLRKERAGLQLAKLKITETELQRSTKKAELQNKAINTINSWNTTANQVNQYRKTTQNYNELLQGENRLFNIGESSLFMINSREMAYINAQIKLVELTAKNQKAELATQHALGVLSP
ncbi:TolC family protein [Owenweeksia hongkongensis]|uniref:TolC family protein n=1 Tax=Owenweeksia hongkongensis TaxID=253245 RepID=UPI003A919141